MSENLLHIELCSSEHEPVGVDAIEVIVPGGAGVFTVLPGHTPLLTDLTEGVVIATPPEGGEPEFFAVHRGFCEVADNRITILADVMETRAMIDEARAKDALKRAEDALRKPDPELDVVATQAALARALARLQAHAGES